MSSPVAACPKCRQPIPADAPAGLCPRCLAVGAFSETSPAKNPATVTDPDPTLHIVIPEDSGLPADAPRKLGDYELLEEIARGGMGIVYKAWQPSLDRFVAVKTIRSGLLATRTDVERFEREAKAAAKLHHPNIIAIHEIGEQDGQHYFAMDYVPGESLATLARRQPFLPEQAAQITAAVAEAIHYAHQQGVLHRDVKPANVILGPDGPRVLDFGLARLAEDDSQLTQSGAPMGSPCYMAPEQAAGKVRTLDARTDVYALGAMLYELLTGRPPFQAATVIETLRLVQETEPVTLRRINPSLPADVETICLKCLEKEPTKRYQSAQELSEELGRFGRDEPIHARPVNTPEKLWRWCRRKPALASMAAALTVAVVVGSTGVVWQSAARKTALIETRRLLYAANMIVVHQDLENGNYQKAQELLLTHRPEHGEEDLRGFEWRYLWQLSQGEQLSVLGRCTSGILSVAVSPDGKFVASANKGGAVVKVWDLPGHRQVQALTNHTAPVNCVAFSPDGETLASGSDDHTIKLWDTRTWRLKASLERHTNAVITVKFSGDGRTMASRSDDLSVILWDTATGRERTTLTNITKWGGPMALSADGGTLFVGDNNAVRVWDVENRKLKLELPSNEPFGINTIDLSPDERTLAAGYGNGVVTMVWNLTTQSAERITPTRLERTKRPAFSPDSRWLAVATADTGRIELWDLQTWTRQSTLRGHPPGNSSIVFSPDGKTVISGSDDKTIRIWPTGAQVERDIFRGHTNYVWSVAFSPDGNTLASGSWDSSVRLWDVRTGQLKEVLKTTHPVYGVAFSPDGKILAAGGGEEVSPGEPGEVRLWNLDERREIAAFEAHHEGVRSIIFTTDGKTLATASSDGTIKLWDTFTRRELTTLNNHTGAVWDLASSYNGAMLASAGDGGTARLWDVKEGKELATFGGHSGYLRVALSPDAKTLATVSWDKTLRIWDIASRKETMTRLRLNGGPMALAYCSDGRTVATSGWDGVIKLWNVISQREVATLKPQSRGVLSLAFSPDGKILTAGSADGSVRLWRGASLAEIGRQIENSKEVK
ncbi:MAG: protein kinase [Verrucomicrobia bacterium]|nr:protein kinase [Verrucomicrobiota bacterium]